VESTYNWYWLVDGLRSRGYPIHLANPARMEQYSGIKHADDKNDAFFLAELQRLNILPTGYIYDPALRPVRDLLRRRLSLVRQRTALLLSFKSLYARTTGEAMPLRKVKVMAPDEAKTLYQHPANSLIASLQKEHIDKLSQSIGVIEKSALSCARELPCYENLLSLPAVGRILGLTIRLEVGQISPFKTPGHFASYCRTVDSRRLSNAPLHDRDANLTGPELHRRAGHIFLFWTPDVPIFLCFIFRFSKCDHAVGEFCDNIGQAAEVRARGRFTQLVEHRRQFSRGSTHFKSGRTKVRPCVKQSLKIAHSAP
jgi:transposase